MNQMATATKGLFCDRDLFVHDGTRLRRLRLSAPVQAMFAALLLALLGWSAFATARMIAPTRSAAAIDVDLAGLIVATEYRARRIEQRQQLLAAMLAGEEVDAAALARTAAAPALPSKVGGALARVEDAQQLQADAATRTIDARYRNAAAALRKLGINPARFATDAVGGPKEAMGGPFEPVTSADPTFKALFNSWKKLDQLQDGAIAVPSDKPVKSAEFTSGYGVRSDPFQGRAAMHPGIDLAGPLGTPIYATADGIVLRSGWNAGGYGNLVEIDHGRGIATRYGHLSAVLVKAGHRVKRGDLIARMGSTGRSTGSHLHYEVRIDGRAVNPIPFMKSTDYLVAIQRRTNSAPLDSLALGGPQR